MTAPGDELNRPKNGLGNAPQDPPCVAIEIPGRGFLVVDLSFLPPVGAKVALHKHLYDGGTSLTLEIISHEWSVDDETLTPEGEPKNPSLAVRIRTRIVDR